VRFCGVYFGSGEVMAGVSFVAFKVFQQSYKHVLAILHQHSSGIRRFQEVVVGSNSVTQSIAQ